MQQIYQGAKQAENLTMELNCIGWASDSCSTVSVRMLNVEVALKAENWLNKRTAVESGPYFFVFIDKVYSK